MRCARNSNRSSGFYTTRETLKVVRDERAPSLVLGSLSLVVPWSLSVLEAWTKSEGPRTKDGRLHRNENRYRPTIMTVITPETLLARIKSGDAPVVLDVRSRREFESGHVPGAIHIPFWDVGKRSISLPADPGEPIVVYCGHGPRAWMAGTSLRRRGFSKILYLEGHMSTWKTRGFPREVEVRG
jgi:rhodanese-related sulfurtransferase